MIDHATSKFVDSRLHFPTFMFLFEDYLKLKVRKILDTTLVPVMCLSSIIIKIRHAKKYQINYFYLLDTRLLMGVPVALKG